MPEYIPKEKNLNFNNSSNKSDLSSISKFSKSSDNLEYYQNMANSSLKVSQLQKIQDTANKNVLQRVVPNKGEKYLVVEIYQIVELIRLYLIELNLMKLMKSFWLRIQH